MTTCASSRVRSSASSAVGGGLIQGAGHRDPVERSIGQVGDTAGQIGEQAGHLRALVGRIGGGDAGGGGAGQRFAVGAVHADELGAHLVGGGPHGDGAAVLGAHIGHGGRDDRHVADHDLIDVPLLLPVLRTVRPRCADFSASFGVVDSNTVPSGPR